MKKTLLGMALLFTASLHAAPLVTIEPAQQQALGISTIAVEPVTRAWGSTYPAKVRVPNAQLMVVSAPQEGLLSVLKVAEGEPVHKGQVLAVIQSPKLVEEQRLYLEARSRLGLSRAELNRDKQLKAEGIIADRRFLETRARYMQARTEVDQRQQALLLAGMGQPAIDELEKKHKLSANLVVRSPLDGVILAQLAMPGQRVEMASPIYRIGRLNPLWLEIQVPLEQLRDIAVGTAVRVPKFSVEGKVITIGSMIHGEDQGVLVRAEIPNAGSVLRPGQFVEAQLAQAGDKKAWRVLRQALLRVNGKTWVMVGRSAGFQPVEVSISAEEADALIIKGNLKAGDNVAVSGTAALKAAWLEGEG
ncbi:efflux RND transporter periplasmic adaptor subunit [Thiolapillus sp.]|uniref:efflux RND transporter periplasmic adaptor subunit n=1 Tax=Thiolapillus sp. TaxID=2017437 RepID=UPI0025FA9427